MNSINRNNYETFFLLYIDNELTMAEKEAVDEFVQVNPDLKEELVLLQQSILSSDTIVFERKGSLLKDEADYYTAIQEKLLLYLDNELLPVEKIELDGLIKTDPIIEKEYNLLQQTKLLADSEIVFEGRQSLYRKENVRVVAFPWKRLMAAAVFVGFGLWGGLVYFNNDINLVEGKIAKEIQDQPNLNIPKITPSQTAEEMVSAGISEKGKTMSTLITTQSSAKGNLQPTEKINPLTLTEGEVQTIVLNEITNNLPIPNLDNINSIGSNKAITAIVTPEQQISTIVIPGSNAIAERTAREDAASNVYASAASFTDNSEESDNHVLFMDEEKIKKSKLGGMFRKVKRVIERNTNIKPGGNSIKVANLEFAIQ